MQLTSLVAVGLAVASTNAILLPPDIGIPDEETFSILPHPIADQGIGIAALGRDTSISLDCPGCPVRKYHRTGKTTTHTNLKSHLELDFSVKQLNGQDVLLLNGLPIFPSALAMGDKPLTARLLPDFKKKNHDFVQAPDPETLGFSLSAWSVRKDPKTNLELFAVDLQIIEVGNVFIEGIDMVEAAVLKTPNNKLVLAEVSITPPQATPPSGSNKDCSSLLCQVKNMFKGVFSGFGSFKPCTKPAPMSGEIVGDADEAFSEPPARHGRPGHHGHHGHHGHGRHGPKGHNWGHLLASIASQILLPIAFGVFAGVSASVLGMMVGTLVVHIWRVCVRGGGRCPRRRGAESCHKASADEVVVEEEKAGLMAHQEDDVEAPPAYNTESK